MMENWHGVDGSAPAVRMEELVTVLRKLWRLDQGPVHHEGRFYKVHLGPTADTPPPFRERLPIYTAGVNPRMVESAGRVADGLVGHPMFTQRYVEEVVRPAVAKGAAKMAATRREIELAGVLICSVDEDVEAARRAARLRRRPVRRLARLRPAVRAARLDGRAAAHPRGGPRA